MQPRNLAPSEATLLLQALAYHERRVRDELSEAATDNRLESIQQHYSALLLCDGIQRSVRAGHFRVIQG